MIRVDVIAMLEIEMKFRVENAQAYEALLKEEQGVEFGAPLFESDVFFTNAALGFPNEGKSLRVRRSGDLLATTFKGPRLDSTTKAREEIELSLAPKGCDEATLDKTRDDWIRFYERLGFQPFGAVEKTRRRARTVFAGREFEITLDVVDSLGVFTELETLAPQAEFVEARAVLLALADKLGLRDTITKSYLALTLEASTGRAVVEK